MMVSVIQKAFLSFPSSQPSGKNEVFLDFIPVILASFRHLGVIQRFSQKRNDVGMMENFGLKLTTFPWLTLLPPLTALFRPSPKVD